MATDQYVYTLRSEDGECIYIGCTESLTKRLIAHAKREWWSDVSRIDYETLPDRTQALKRESDLIGELEPRENKTRGWLTAYTKKARTFTKDDEMRSPKQLLLEMEWRNRYGSELADMVSHARSVEGVSWRDLARSVSADTDITITYESLRSWYDPLAVPSRG